MCGELCWKILSCSQCSIVVDVMEFSVARIGWLLPSNRKEARFGLSGAASSINFTLYRTLQRNASHYPPYHLSFQLSRLPTKMMRATAVRALRAVAKPQFTQQISAIRPQLTTSFLQSSRNVPSFVVPSIRCYSAPAGLSKEETQGRIMDLLKNFDKVCLRVRHGDAIANIMV